LPLFRSTRIALNMTTVCGDVIIITWLKLLTQRSISLFLFDWEGVVLRCIVDVSFDGLSYEVICKINFNSVDFCSLVVGITSSLYLFYDNDQNYHTIYRWTCVEGHHKNWVRKKNGNHFFYVLPWEVQWYPPAISLILMAKYSPFAF
jgi:hypothetical protein